MPYVPGSYRAVGSPFALVGRVGKGTVPLHMEHVCSRLRSKLGNLDPRRVSTHVCFVDFAGAYDSVDHARLLLKLERIGVRGPVLSIIAEMLNGRTTVGRTVNK